MTRFAVPVDLLRLASEDHDGPSATAPLAASAPEPISGPAQLPPGVALPLGLFTAGAAVTLSTPASVWVHAARVERALHASASGIAAVLVATVICALAVAPITGLVADRWGRGRVSAIAVASGAVAAVLAAAAPSLSVLALALGLAGMAASGWVTAQTAWLAGAVPEPARRRALAINASALPFGVILGAAAVWRWGLLVALAGLPVAVALGRALRSPTTDAGADRSPDVAIAPTAHALRRTGVAPALAAVVAAVALLALGGPILFATHVRDHWHLVEAGRRGALLRAAVGVPIGAVIASLTGRRPRHAAGGLGGAGALIALAGGLHWLGLVEVLWAAALAGVTVAAVVTARSIMAVVADGVTATALGLLAGWGLLLGGTATVVLSAMDQANGTTTAQLVLGVGLVAAAGLAARADRAFDRDVAGVEDPVAHGGASAGRRPALEVTNVTFSYGQRQVLFGVGLTVAEGEVAALLGTNGAGKSTLLRLVAGLDHPSGGRIRIHGRETTFLEAEQVGARGVGLLCGGRMSFPGLTVVENLRLGCHRLRRNSSQVRAAIDEALALFPALADRRDQRVGTLSGGEQQMLALARALLTRPRLLLIDELTLGLAPKVVEGLLAIVRRINQQGTTILIVEQSANLALTLADHAYFLERGEVRFDGPTAELLRRDDLLRPVFLGRR